MKRMNMNRPKVKMIGGPWLLLLMGAISILGLVISVLSGKFRPQRSRLAGVLASLYSSVRKKK